MDGWFKLPLYQWSLGWCVVGISTTPSFQQTAAAAAQVEVLSPRLRCYGSAPPTESCRRGAGVAVVALALPSLKGTT